MKKLILLLILIFSLPVAAQNFTIGKSTFLLNGKYGAQNEAYKTIY